MPLPDLTQTLFLRALMDADHPIPNGLIDGHGRPAGRRFNVYRNNVITSLKEALHTGFPVLQKLLGAENFNMLAHIYAVQHPPRSVLLYTYGETLPSFIETIPDLARYPYLADVARLELALRSSYHSADHSDISSHDIEQLTPDHMMRLRLRLAPSVYLLHSHYPIYDIWRFTTQDDAPTPTPCAQCVAIVRPLYDPVPLDLTLDDYGFLSALGRDAPLADAINAVDPQYDPSPLLQRLIEHNAIADIIPQRGHND